MVLNPNEDSFDTFLNIYKKTVRFGRELQAFSFAKCENEKSFLGTAFEFVFDTALSLHSMPFNRLYAMIDNNYYGFCFDRFIAGKYEGRCLYLNIDRPANNLLEYIKSKFKT